MLIEVVVVGRPLLLENGKIERYESDSKNF
jgi:hypothetical protein